MLNIEASYWPVIVATLVVFAGLIGLYVKVDRFMEQKMKEPLDGLRSDMQGFRGELKSLQETSGELKSTSGQLKETVAKQDKGAVVLKTQMENMEKTVAEIKSDNTDSHSRIYKRLENVEKDVSALKAKN